MTEFERCAAVVEERCVAVWLRETLYVCTKSSFPVWWLSCSRWIKHFCTGPLQRKSLRYTHTLSCWEIGSVPVRVSLCWQSADKKQCLICKESQLKSSEPVAARRPQKDFLKIFFTFNGQNGSEEEEEAYTRRTSHKLDAGFRVTCTHWQHRSSVLRMRMVLMFSET